MRKKHRIIAICLVVTGFFATAPSTHADTITPPAGPAKAVNFFMAPFKILIKKIEQRKENKEANKNVRNEIIEKQKNNGSEISPSPTQTTSINLLNDIVWRMDNIVSRIDSRIKKIEADGTNLNVAKKELAKARQKISEAYADLDTLASSTPNTSIDTKNQLDAIVENTSDIRDTLKKTTELIDQAIELSAQKKAKLEN